MVMLPFQLFSAQAISTAAGEVVVRLSPSDRFSLNGCAPVSQSEFEVTYQRFVVNYLNIGCPEYRIVVDAARMEGV